MASRIGAAAYFARHAFGPAVHHGGGVLGSSWNGPVIAEEKLDRRDGTPGAVRAVHSGGERSRSVTSSRSTSWARAAGRRRDGAGPGPAQSGIADRSSCSAPTRTPGRVGNKGRRSTDRAGTKAAAAPVAIGRGIGPALTPGWLCFRGFVIGAGLGWVVVGPGWGVVRRRSVMRVGVWVSLLSLI